MSSGRDEIVGAVADIFEFHGAQMRALDATMQRAVAATDGLNVQLAPIAHLSNCPVCSGVPRPWHAYCHEGNLLHRRVLGEDV